MCQDLDAMDMGGEENLPSTSNIGTMEAEFEKLPYSATAHYSSL